MEADNLATKLTTMSWINDYNKLWDLLKSGNCNLQHELHDVEWGDEYYSGDGQKYRLWTDDKR